MLKSYDKKKKPRGSVEKRSHWEQLDGQTVLFMAPQCLKTWYNKLSWTLYAYAYSRAVVYHSQKQGENVTHKMSKTQTWASVDAVDPRCPVVAAHLQHHRRSPCGQQ